jgi:hypothetical protein
VFVSKWGTEGNSVDGVEVAPNGSVYVLDSANNRIQKFSVGPVPPTERPTAVPTKRPTGPVASSQDYFTIGSTKAEVLALQGQPDRFWDTQWNYGNYEVYFQGGLVARWDNVWGNLTKAMLE